MEMNNRDMKAIEEIHSETYQLRNLIRRLRNGEEVTEDALYEAEKASDRVMNRASILRGKFLETWVTNY